MKILAYNLEFGGRKQLEVIYEVLAHINADVIGLTEADDQEVIPAPARSSSTKKTAIGCGMASRPAAPAALEQNGREKP